MENDKQVDLINVDQTKKIFLSEELLVKDEKPEVYSLAEEYAKSRKNRNFLVYILSLIYISVIGCGVFLITGMEENKNNRIEVNIAEFRQFNLDELLSEQKENEIKLDQLQQELEELRIRSQKEIEKLSPKEQQKALAAVNEKAKQIEESYRQQIQSKEEAIKTLKKNISENERKLEDISKQQIQEIEKEIKELKRKNETALQREDLYKQQIQDREKEINELKDSLNKEKQQSAVTTQTTDATLEKYKSANQLQEIELQRLKSEYTEKIAQIQAEHQEEIERLKKENQSLTDELTLRYNPVFSHGEIATVLNSKLGNSGNPNVNKYSKILNEENVWSEQDYNQLRNKIRDQRVIIDSLIGVKYTNSVPSALNRLDRLSKSISGDYETLWGNLAQRMKEKNDHLGNYEYAFNYLSTIRRESGYVIEARDQNRILVFINHVYSVKKGDTAYIFKNDDLAIAKIELNPERGRVTARVTAVLKPAKIEPFDKILLKLEVDQ